MSLYGIQTSLVLFLFPSPSAVPFPTPLKVLFYLVLYYPCTVPVSPVQVSFTLFHQGPVFLASLNTSSFIIQRLEARIHEQEKTCSICISGPGLPHLLQLHLFTCKFHFSPWLHSISLFNYTTFPLSTHQLRSTEVVSIFRYCEQRQQRRRLSKCLWNVMSSPLGRCQGVTEIGHLVHWQIYF